MCGEIGGSVIKMAIDSIVSKTRLLIACFLLLAFAVAGCLLPADVGYMPDPSLHTAGWTCPKNEGHWVPHTNPPCTWIPGGLFFKSCMDEEVQTVNEARGCSPESSSTAVSTATPSHQSAAPTAAGN
jgi:hypothetical protein